MGSDIRGSPGRTWRCGYLLGRGALLRSAAMQRAIGSRPAVPPM